MIADLAFENFFGMVEIDWKSGSLSDYNLQYQRKSAFWSYFLVNKNNRSDFDQLLVKDNGTATEPYVVNSFPKQGGTLTIASKPV